MHLADLEPDLLLSAAYARIVPESVLAIAKLGAINVHPSLLPDYRGVSAVWWALYEGCSQVGVTIHKMTVPVDTGPIIAQRTLRVNPESDPVTVWRALGELAQPLLKGALETIRESGRVAGTPQPEGGSYRSQPQREARRLEIDWSQPADELVRRDRIFPGHANIAAVRWRIYAARVDPAGPTKRSPGSILRQASEEHPGRRWRRNLGSTLAGAVRFERGRSSSSYTHRRAASARFRKPALAKAAYNYQRSRRASPPQEFPPNQNDDGCQSRQCHHEQMALPPFTDLSIGQTHPRLHLAL